MSNQFDNPDEFNSELDESLDQALTGWGKQRTADRTHLDSARQEVINKIHSREQVDELNYLSPKDNTSEKNQIVWVLAAAAALALITTIGWSIWLDSASNKNTNVAKSIDQPSDLDLSAMKLASTTFATQKTLLNGFQDVFGSDMSCVTEVDGNVNVELNNTSLDQNFDSEFLAVRLVLMSLQSGKNQQWQTVREINLLTEQERRVDVPSPHGEMEISVWAYPVDSNLVSIDLQCQSTGTLPIDVATTELQKSGQSHQIFSTVQDGVEYRLYQTAFRMDQDNEKDGMGIRNTSSDQIQISRRGNGDQDRTREGFTS